MKLAEVPSEKDNASALCLSACENECDMLLSHTHVRVPSKSRKVLYTMKPPGASRDGM
jgi:hypothetical protein